jgi:hypothetical protein
MNAKLIDALSKESFWGPFLVLAGIFTLIYPIVIIKVDNPVASYTLIAVGIFLLAVGVYFMLRQLSYGAKLSSLEYKPGSLQDADYIVNQLSKNYELLRAQTNQGFLLSSVFMLVGLIVIIASLFAPSFGWSTVNSEGVKGLGVVAGIITEFISGTAIFIYRDNFTRLNKTSDRLDESWRVLAAYKLTEELPEDKKSEATLNLITALTQRSK